MHHAVLSASLTIDKPLTQICYNFDSRACTINSYTFLETQACLPSEKKQNVRHPCLFSSIYNNDLIYTRWYRIFLCCCVVAVPLHWMAYYLDMFPGFYYTYYLEPTQLLRAHLMIIVYSPKIITKITIICTSVYEFITQMFLNWMYTNLYVQLKESNCIKIRM